MILPDPAMQARQRRRFRIRLVPMSIALALVIAAAVLPHVRVVAATASPER